jgi:hypothetical protein
LLPLRRRHSTVELLAPLARALANRRSAVFVGLVCASAAVVLGLGTSTFVPVDFMEEGGPVEVATAWLYLVAFAVVLLIRLPGLTGLDKAAICLLLLAFAAREADLHASLFEVSILKASFYRRHGTPGQIAVAHVHPAAGAVFLPAAAQATRCSLARRAVELARPRGHADDLRRADAGGQGVRPHAGGDRRAADLEAMPDRVRHVLLALEEVLELALPLLAILAIVQGRLPARLSRSG